MRRRNHQKVPLPQQQEDGQHVIKEMTESRIVVENAAGETEQYDGDSVVCALGLKPRRELLEKLREELPDVHIIPVGDVNKARKIIQATHESFHAGRIV